MLIQHKCLNIYYFFFSYLFVLITSHDSEPIIEPFIDYYNSCDMFILIGNTTKIENFYLNLQSTFLWTMASIHKFKEDNTLRFIKDDIITLENYPSNVTLHEGTIRFNSSNTIIHNFPFYQTPDLCYLEFDSIPLAHYFKNESFSIVNRLYMDGKISHKSFGFIFQALNITENREIGYVFFGNVPNDIINSYPYKVEFYINDYKSKEWICQLISLQFHIENEDNIYENHYKSYFNLDSLTSKAPKHFMNYLRENVFNKLIDEQVCEYNVKWNGKDILCNCEQIKESHIKMEMIISGTKFTFTGEEMFIKTDSEDKCVFFIELNYLNENDWVIAGHFLKKYISLFDYFNHKVVLFGKEKFNIIYKDIKKSTVIKILLQGLSLLLINCVFILIKMKLKFYTNIF